MTDTNDQLTELFTLANEWQGGIENCPWWPQAFVERTVDDRGDIYWQYIDRDMIHQHALAIIRDAAERWLAEMGWHIHTASDGRLYNLYQESDGKIACMFDGPSLSEALKHARGITETVHGGP